MLVMHSFQLISNIWDCIYDTCRHVFAVETLYLFQLFKIKLLAPVSLFVVYNGMLMPVAMWINSMDNDIGQVFDSNSTTLFVFYFLGFFLFLFYLWYSLFVTTWYYKLCLFIPVFYARFPYQTQ